MSIFSFLLGAGLWILFLVAFYYILQIIAMWNIFKKAGQPGWKSLIPVYNYYILFKISWSGGMFFLTFGLAILAAWLLNRENVQWAQFLGNAASIAVGILSLIETWKLSKAYGHGFGYFLGLIFLQPIFILILGFGSSRYVRKK